MEKRIVHVDMDAFFAAVEQRDNPSLRGKPVIIGAPPREGAGRGVVSTCSYEAREFGVHSAMPISRAWRACPHGIYLSPHMSQYSAESKKIMSLLADFSPVIEKISIDEAFLDCSGTEHLFGESRALGTAIKEKIRKECGLTASVGIASNKSVAKIASDLEKPDGLVICPPGEEAAFLAPLPVQRLWGAGPRTVERLEKMGITTIGELASFSEEGLTRHFGRWGAHLRQMALGIDHRSLETESERKSISEERTFSADTGETELLEKMLLSLSQDVAAELRRKKMKARTVTLKLRFSDFTTLTRSRTLQRYFDDTVTLHRNVRDLFRSIPRLQKVRLIGVGVSGMEEGEVYVQPALFAEENGESRKVDKAMDEVARKHGKVITRAGLLGKKEPPHPNKVDKKKGRG
ncbi:MAG TPA: DNA polymerase IV [Candidatus Mcinerneyibacteriales bacterium]|nr:DNA polymerase IV [Candidatus Mcinerneyibacteriales bacterium]